MFGRFERTTGVRGHERYSWMLNPKNPVRGKTKILKSQRHNSLYKKDKQIAAPTRTERVQSRVYICIAKSREFVTDQRYTIKREKKF